MADCLEHHLHDVHLADGEALHASDLLDHLALLFGLDELSLGLSLILLVLSLKNLADASRVEAHHRVGVEVYTCPVSVPVLLILLGVGPA